MRILEKGDINLKEAMEIAQTFEVTSAQTKAMGSDVARITTRKEKVRRGKPSSFKVIKCYRCGYHGHVQSDEKCPAKDKKCLKCKKKGHFAAMCKTHRAGSYDDTDQTRRKSDQTAVPTTRREKTNYSEAAG